MPVRDISLFLQLMGQVNDFFLHDVEKQELDFLPHLCITI